MRVPRTASVLSAPACALAALTALPVAVSAGADQGGGSGGGERELTAVLLDAEGERVGRATVSARGGGSEVDVDVAGLPPGFHGLHVHAIGVCEPDSPNPSDPSLVGDFLSAGGHWNPTAADHGQHTGDLPSLLVDAEGRGELETDTGAFVPRDLLDDDGTAVMIHAGPDNFANIPERYAPGGPDDVTRATGDSGGRIACGVLERD